MKSLIKKKAEQTNVAVFAIIAALSVALILVGLGYAAFVASNLDSSILKEQSEKDKDQQTASKDSTKNELPAADLPVDVSEIDKKIDELDKEFDKNKSADDFSSDQFSDKALDL
ncbi:hypothetical protein KA529_00705 [Candidatus Saccharibacteria bacterium]|jgi:peptidoglycan hydrolase CwlO-like protein|nr:hypothetical protein [Candidatus Saccharibacteria bacterium]